MQTKLVRYFNSQCKLIFDCEPQLHKHLKKFCIFTTPSEKIIEENDKQKKFLKKNMKVDFQPPHSDNTIFIQNFKNNDQNPSSFEDLNNQNQNIQKLTEDLNKDKENLYLLNRSLRETETLKFVKTEKIINDELDKMIQLKRKENDFLRKKLDEKQNKSIPAANLKPKNEKIDYFSQSSNASEKQHYFPPISSFPTKKYENNQNRIKLNSFQSQKSIQQPIPTFDDFVKDNLLINKPRDYGMNLHERYLTFLQAQEIDSLRILQRLHPDSDLYKIKLDRYQESCHIKSEIERTINEQILREFKQKFDQNQNIVNTNFENKIWIDQKKRELIELNIDQKTQNNIKIREILPRNDVSNKSYSLNSIKESDDAKSKKSKIDFDQNLDVFFVFWEAIVGDELFEKSEFQLAVGLFRIGKQIFGPVKVTKNHNFESSLDVKSFGIGNSTRIQNKEVSTDILLILEVKRVEGLKIDSIGWGAISLYAENGLLKEGNWKSPIFELPIDFGTRKSELANLNRMGESFVCFRINRDQTQFLHVIKSLKAFQNSVIHKVYCIDKFDDQSFERNVTEVTAYEDFYEDPKEIDQDIESKRVENEDSQSEKSIKPEKEEEDDYKISSKPEFDPEFTHESKIETKIGFKLLIVNLISQFDISEVQIIISIVSDKIEINEKNISSIKILELSQYKEPKKVIVKNKNGEEKKAFSFSICDELLFLIDLDKFKGKKNYLVLKISGREKNVIAKSKSLRSSLFRRMSTKGRRDVAYTALLLPENLTTQAYSLEFIKLPFDIDQFENSLSYKNDCARINMKVFRYEYSITQLYNGIKDNLDQLKFYNRQKVFSKNSSNLFEGFPKNAFISNTLYQYNEAIFDDSSSIFVTILKMRNLPNNVTIVRGLLRMLNPFKLTFSDSQFPFFSDLMSSSVFPNFDASYKLKKDDFNKTSFIFLTFLTFEQQTNKPKIIGYSAINLFLSKYTLLAPTNEKDPNTYLNNGFYEIPIFTNCFDKNLPFSMEKFLSSKKLEGSTVCLLISQEAKELSKNFEKATNYANGFFNNSLCDFTRAEFELIKIRFLKKTITIKDKMIKVVQKISKRELKTNNEIIKFADARLRLEKVNEFIGPEDFELAAFEKGFVVSCDGLINVNENDIFAMRVQLYQKINEKPTAKETNIVHEINWESPINEFRFLNCFLHYRNVKYFQNSFLLIEVYKIDGKSESQNMISVGWIAVPVFKLENTFINGHYCLPLFETQFTKSICNQLLEKNQEVSSKIDQMVKSNTLKSIDKVGLVIRISEYVRNFTTNYPFDGSTFNKLYQKDFSESKYFSQNSTKTKKINEVYHDNETKTILKKTIIKNMQNVKEKEIY